MLCGSMPNLRPLWNSVVPPATWEHYRAALLHFRVWISVTLTWGTRAVTDRGLSLELWQHRCVSFMPMAVAVTLSTSVLSMMMIVAWDP